MASSSASKTLGDFVELQRGNTYQSALLDEAGPVLLGLASIARNGGFRGDNLKTYGGKSDPRMLLGPNEIYVSLKDVTQSADLLGAVARVPQAVSQGRLTQDTVKLVFREKNAPTNYIYWLLRTPQARAYCRAHATGTTNLGLARNDFLAFPIPELSRERSYLAELLQSLEDKIDLNQQINKTLEETARAIFKSWFVDFDPVRAKMKGCDTGLADDVAALFPATFENDEIRQRPKGWNVSSIGQEVDVVGGNTPSTKNADYWGGQFSFATPKDLSNVNAPHLLRTERHLTEAGVRRVSSGLLPAGVVLMSSRAPIGYVAISQVPVCVNQGFAAMVCGGSTGPIYTYFWTLFSMAEIKARASGSTFAEISKSTFRGIEFVRPPDLLSETFEKLAAPLFDRISTNLHNSQALSQTRDLLLPKLMSGETRIKDVESLIAEAGE